MSPQDTVPTAIPWQQLWRALGFLVLFVLAGLGTGIIATHLHITASLIGILTLVAILFGAFLTLASFLNTSINAFHFIVDTVLYLMNMAEQRKKRRQPVSPPQ